MLQIITFWNDNKNKIWSIFMQTRTPAVTRLTFLLYFYPEAVKKKNQSWSRFLSRFIQPEQLELTWTHWWFGSPALAPRVSAGTERLSITSASYSRSGAHMGSIRRYPPPTSSELASCSSRGAAETLTERVRVPGTGMSSVPGPAQARWIGSVL